MDNSPLNLSYSNKKLFLSFSGKLDLYAINSLEKQTDTIDIIRLEEIEIDLSHVISVDTAVAIYINNLVIRFNKANKKVKITSPKQEINDTLDLIKKQTLHSTPFIKTKKEGIVESFGRSMHNNYLGLLSFLEFLGYLFATKLYYLKSIKNIRFKEIAFEINESGVRAFFIIAVTSFLIGLVVAYQSAFQLKMYGANIFIVDMLGISILRELAPLITAIVIAGRSGSAFTAQIGAMKITEELDAMRTMGFDPYIFLVMPRIIALMIVLPILIFVADIMGILGGMLVASIDLDITPSLFLDRFIEAVAIKHFFIGLIKGPFFAFLIASIGIYRGLMVKNDTQSIGVNTTKSVVEAIFAVIVCDALFSIAFTNLGI